MISLQWQTSPEPGQTREYRELNAGRQACFLKDLRQAQRINTLAVSSLVETESSRFSSQEPTHSFTLKFRVVCVHVAEDTITQIASMGQFSTSAFSR